MKYLIPLIALSLITFSSCRKDEPVDPKLPNACNDTAAVDTRLEVSLKFKENEFATGTSYQLNDSTFVVFDVARFYLSNISLQKDSVWLRVSEDVVLVDENQSEFILGKFPQGEIEGIRFALGIDSLRNHADPTQYNAGHPLAFTVPTMHWSWNQGYIFALFEGRFSSQPMNSSNPGEIWYFHIGLDNNYMPSDAFSANLNVQACENNLLKLNADLSMIFNGVDFTNDYTTLSTDNPGLAFRVSSHLIDAITYEN